MKELNKQKGMCDVVSRFTNTNWIMGATFFTNIRGLQQVG
jgi:hypothetical protein